MNKVWETLFKILSVIIMIFLSIQFQYRILLNFWFQFFSVLSHKHMLVFGHPGFFYNSANVTWLVGKIPYTINSFKNLLFATFSSL